MKINMTSLLKYSIRQIDNLHSYYLIHDEYAEKFIKQNIKKYKYGIILNKYFMKQAKPEMGIILSEKEEAIIATMIDEFEVNRNEEIGIVRFYYKLKQGFSVDDKYELDPNIANNEALQLMQQPKILSESVLIMLLIKYEEAISSIYRNLIEKYPQSFLSDKSITYSELIKMNSNIEDIKERFIVREIDTIMREPISNWYDSFRKRQKAQFLFADDVFEVFKEIYYRRNIVVHNNGIVNEIYLSNIKNKNAKIGERLKTTNDYLENAFSITSLILIDTFFGLRKIADDKDELIQWISEYGYNCLVEKKWKQAKYIFRVVLQDDNMQFIDKLIAQINYWISVKNLEGVSAIQDEVSALDVSAMQIMFSVAKAALLNKHEKVSTLLEECIVKQEISAYYIKTWPLLNEYRASDEYLIFIGKHKEELDIGEYETHTDSETLCQNDSDDES